MIAPHPFDQRPWQNLDLPADAARIRTMLTEEEGKLLFWLTRDYADGSGAICDLGCFAGGSTARMAAGVAAAGRQTPVHAFDHFRIGDKQKARFLYPAGIEPFDGPDMEHAVKELLAPWPFVRLRRGDIRKADWNDGLIEILFVDAAKTPEGADRIATTFFPHLIPGRSIIVQQDYLHWPQPWVAAQMELLAGCTEPVAWCLKGTVAFRVTAPITSDMLTAARVEHQEDAALVRLVAQAVRRMPEHPQKARLARAILGIRDNPGVRIPARFDGTAFTPDRVREVLREIG